MSHRLWIGKIRVAVPGGFERLKLRNGFLASPERALEILKRGKKFLDRFWCFSMGFWSLKTTFFSQNSLETRNVRYCSGRYRAGFLPVLIRNSGRAHNPSTPGLCESKRYWCSFFHGLLRLRRVSDAFNGSHVDQSRLGTCLVAQKLHPGLV